MSNTSWQQYNIFRLSKAKKVGSLFDEFRDKYNLENTHEEERYGRKALREDSQNKIDPNRMTDSFNFGYDKGSPGIKFSYDPNIKFDMNNNLLSDRQSSYRGKLHSLLESLTKRNIPETYQLFDNKLHIGKEDIADWKNYLQGLKKEKVLKNDYLLPSTNIDPVKDKIFSTLANYVIHDAPDNHPTIPKFMLDKLEEHYTGQPLHNYLELPMSGTEHIYNPVKANDLPNMIKLLLHHYFLNPRHVFIPHVDVPQHVEDAHTLAKHYIGSL